MTSEGSPGRAAAAGPPPLLVATDLDGTVVRRDGTVSGRTAAAFARLSHARVHTVLVTGRPPAWTLDAARMLGHQGLAVCCNGAIVYDTGSRQVLSERLIAAETLRAAMDRLGAALPAIGFACEYADGLAYEPAYESGGHPHEVAGVPVADVAALSARPAAKLRARHPYLSAGLLHAAGRELLGDLLTVTHTGTERLLEASAPGVDKASALAEVAAGLGVPAGRVVAFGDMPNDLPMLGWAGQAYAVADAHPDVLAGVAARTGTCAADGVAAVLETLVPSGHGG